MLCGPGRAEPGWGSRGGTGAGLRPLPELRQAGSAPGFGILPSSSVGGAFHPSGRPSGRGDSRKRPLRTGQSWQSPLAPRWAPSEGQTHPGAPLMPRSGWAGRDPPPGGTAGNGREAQICNSILEICISALNSCCQVRTAPLATRGLATTKAPVQARLCFFLLEARRCRIPSTSWDRRQAGRG